MSDWLISLSITLSSSIHVIAKSKTSFFIWVSSIPLYIPHIFHIRSSVHGHMGCFPCWATVANATMNIRAHGNICLQQKNLQRSRVLSQLIHVILIVLSDSFFLHFLYFTVFLKFLCFLTYFYSFLCLLQNFFGMVCRWALLHLRLLSFTWKLSWQSRHLWVILFSPQNSPATVSLFFCVQYYGGKVWCLNWLSIAIAMYKLFQNLVT